MKKYILIFILIIFNLSTTTYSKSYEDIEIEKLKKQIKLLETQVKKLEVQKIEKLKNNEKKSKIGLVLSGGGAKGFAHIGVLRILEENNIKVDYITGTSMGALVGALYSVGYSPDEIEKLVVDINWFDTLNEIGRAHV